MPHVLNIKQGAPHCVVIDRDDVSVVAEYTLRGDDTVLKKGDMLQMGDVVCYFKEVKGNLCETQSLKLVGIRKSHHEDVLIGEFEYIPFQGIPKMITDRIFYRTTT